MRTRLAPLVLGLITIGLVSGCNNSHEGISTASVLDGAHVGAGSTGEVLGVKPDDPNARTVQVAWTAARAQRCGFVVDLAKLKANFMTTEAARVGPAANGPGTEKVYDQTFATISSKIKEDPGFCTKHKSDAIKADLSRHLAGNYEPNFPVEKKVANDGLFGSLISDEPAQPFDQKNFWNDQEAKRQGAKGAQN